eukprot:TRINITY_DN12707_c0_g1_i1.p1 TRINITY_DN12707_c0_g1~~TRINITY_DN12707_c0_g1_i1.p1  ORF type:complete len:112 (-),score=32.27 TRINITY_DN12707_c0_g1_i1:71-406(-)
MLRSLVGSEMCIRDRGGGGGEGPSTMDSRYPSTTMLPSSKCSTTTTLPYCRVDGRLSEISGGVSACSRRGSMVVDRARYGSTCLLYTSDAADEEDSVDLGGRRIIKKKKVK